MRRCLFFIFFCICILVIINDRDHAPKKHPEGCLSCHQQVSDPNASHPVKALGCRTCHLGNPYAYEKKRAHDGMVKNPGSLAYASKTCAAENCHPQMFERVRNSIMATNRGILKKLSTRLGASSPGDMDVESLTGSASPSTTYIALFRKMCAGCHLWKKRDTSKGEIGRRGGGCSDCHIVDTKHADTNQNADSTGPFTHPELTKNIPSDNCIKCHNRSARIGLSYFGTFESEGYGTPFKNGQPNPRRLTGGRHTLQLSADIHYKKYKLSCIDCHTAAGLMGDGRRYDRMVDQIEISCRTCHAPRFVSPAGYLKQLAQENKQPITFAPGTQIAVTEKKNVLPHLRKTGADIFFYPKSNPTPIRMNSATSQKPYHTFRGHERLSCQACHSAWIPQCYGCHTIYRQDQDQKDWISGQQSRGRFIEKKSYYRFSRPTLGINARGKVAPLSPCQVIFTAYAQNGMPEPEKSVRHIGVASFDPHTTTTLSRTCHDCHADPKSLGFGNGIFHLTKNRRRFRYTHQDTLTSGQNSFPFDAYVLPMGDILIDGQQSGERPFTAPEQQVIMSVNACIACHDRYEDAIYLNFRFNLNRFEKDRSLPCWRIIKKYLP